MEQQMLYLDFNGICTADLLGITNNRLDEICTNLSDVAFEIAENFKDYCWQKQNRKGLHKGKIIQKLLESYTEPQEIVAVLMVADNIIYKIRGILKEIGLI